MSPVSVTWRRTLGTVRNMYSAAFAVGGFLVAAAVLFSFGLEASEGGRSSLAVVWVSSLSPILPILAAFLAMGTWSDERQSGRIDALLSAAVRERSLVFGKFFGVWTVLSAVVLASLAATVLALFVLAPAALRGVGIVSFLPALLVLVLQGALWSAVSVMTSALTRHAAVAACASVALTVAVPRCLWAALLAWAPQGRTAFGEMPFDAHAIDIASGVVSLNAVAFYAVLTLLSLFIATKVVASFRFVGRGAFSLRVSTVFAVVLSLVFAVMALLLVQRLDMSADLPVGGASTQFSLRMRKTLSEIDGDLTVTCFLSRRDARFRSIGIMLRALQREAGALGGVRVVSQFVDPRWDLGAAERLVRMGAREESVVFEKAHRVVVLPLKDGFDEHVCLSAIRRVAMPPQRRNVYWTSGHGETSFDSYDAQGMSDIARELVREGYLNSRIDLASAASVPSDCALILIVGARDDFSRPELGKIDAYLKQGGRLLDLQSGERGGVSSLLSSWGVRLLSNPLTGARTLSGSDVIVSEFSDHVISSPLRGSQIVLERPLVFAPSAAAENGFGADKLDYCAVANVGAQTVAAAVERGSGAGNDLAIRPTRIVVVGDASFVMNGQLTARANANRDFFLNCVAYLSGSDAASASGAERGVLESGMDRSERIRFVMVLGGVIPLMVFLTMCLATAVRRHRT